MKITLTEEQQTWLLRFLNREWNDEIEYQSRNEEIDEQYLNDILDVYIAILGKPTDWIHAYSIKVDIEDKLKEIKELKHEKN